MMLCMMLEIKNENQKNPRNANYKILIIALNIYDVTMLNREQLAIL